MWRAVFSLLPTTLIVCFLMESVLSHSNNLMLKVIYYSNITSLS